MRALIACALLSQLAAAPPMGERLKRATQVGARILIRTDHAPVVVAGESYRLVAGRAPMVATIRREKGARVGLVAYVVRLGTRNEPAEGATPLVVTVDGKQHLFPTRPRLVSERVVDSSGRDVEIASYPVRYPLGRLRGQEVSIRVALRRPERGGGVGVRLAVEPLSGRDRAPRNRLVKRKRRAKKPPAAPAPEPVAVDAGSVVAAAGDRLDDELELPSDAGPLDGGRVDAGVAVAEAPPPPPPARGRVTISLVNKLGAAFKLHRIEVAIDGLPIDLPKWRGFERGKRIPLYDGELSVGPHFVDVSLMYVGSGGLLFSYMDEYTFHAGDGRRVRVEKDGHMDIRVEAYEGGNFITEMVDRPALRIQAKRVAP